MAKNQRKEKKKVQWSTAKRKKRAMMNPIWCRMKKGSPSSGQNGQLVHW
jgi:hypothetical protein